MSARVPVRTYLLLLPLALWCASCSRSVDIKQALEVTDTSSGWFDAGIVEGKNKIVPSVTFRLTKQPDADLAVVALNVVFRHPAPAGTAEEDWDEVYIQRADFKAANQTEPMTVRPEKGYTGDPPQSRQDILRHSLFRDVRARVYAKYTSSQWVEIGSIDVPRQLIVR